MKNGAKQAWRKTRTALLWEHVPTRTYYARIKVRGKDVWKSLETDLLTVAKAKLPDVVDQIRGAVNRRHAPTVEAALRMAAEGKAADPDRKPRTAAYYRWLVPTIVATFPDPGLRLDRVRPADLKAWHDQHSTRYAPSRTNGCLSLWKRVFKDGIEAGWVARDPAAELPRRRQPQTRLVMPTPEQFAAIVEHIRTEGRAHRLAAAFAVELMAYTGLRKNEAAALRWRDISGRGIVLRTLKNDVLRTVPLIPACADLLDRMREVCNHRPDDRVIGAIPRHSLTSACEKLGLPHMRIHDLRHLFATRCLEAGVPFPTLAVWLGHKDGGTLAAKTYGHVTEAHGSEMAGRVRA